MKLYNPFKPHIIEIDSGEFAVRKLTFIGWRYKERSTFRNDDIFWWISLDYVKKHCLVNSLDEAIDLRDKIKVEFIKPVKIHK